MNRDELEQWMKDSLAKQEFIPTEAAWDKLRTAMDTPAGKDRKKAMIFLLPKRLRIAASVALCTAAGSLAYYMGRDHGTRISGSTIATVQPVPAAPLQKNQMPVATAASNHDELQRHTGQPQLQKGALPHPAAHTNDSNTYVYTPPAEPVHSSDSSSIKPNVYAAAHSTTIPDPLFRDPLHETQNTTSFNLGLAAQFGKANVGNMRYQVGVVAHQEIAGNLYAEATVALAATEVSYVQTSSFASLTISSGAYNSIASKSVEARYTNNILSAGVSPALGYRITPKLALGCGMSLYRNLNPTVSLKEDATMDQAVLDNHLLSESKAVSGWDAGLTGNAAYTIGNKLAVSIQYRHGLSAFMYLDGQPVRNSGFNMGLKYLFGK